MKILLPLNTQLPNLGSEYVIVPYVTLSANVDLQKVNNPRMKNIAYFINSSVSHLDKWKGEIITDDFSIVKQDNSEQIILDLSENTLNSEIIQWIKEKKVKKCIINLADLNFYQKELKNLEVFIKYPGTCPYTKCHSLNCKKDQYGYMLCNIDFDSNSWFFYDGDEDLSYEEQQEIFQNFFDWKQWLDKYSNGTVNDNAKGYNLFMCL